MGKILFTRRGSARYARYGLLGSLCHSEVERHGAVDSTVALRRGASFTATQTFSNVSIGTSGATAITKPNDGHTLVSLGAVSLAAGAKFTFPATNGLLVITLTTAGSRSSVYVDGQFSDGCAGCNRLFSDDGHGVENQRVPQRFFL
jgi:hypothetical protein